MSHKNATKVFPSGLVREIQKYYSGGYLWISNQGNEERNEKIRVLYKGGESIESLAKKMNLSERWVWQIIQKSINEVKSETVFV